jgi:hypothetical protein
MEEGSHNFIQNICWFLMHYMVLHPGWQNSW